MLEVSGMTQLLVEDYVDALHVEIELDDVDSFHQKAGS